MQKGFLRLQKASPEWVLNSFAKFPGGRRKLTVNGVSYRVRNNSHRYLLFREKGLTCVECGRTANKCFLELPKYHLNPHFNFYLCSDGKELLFTKDHIIPKSKGGKDVLENYQTMCKVISMKT